MKEVLDFLYANPMGCLATVENGKPRVRPWRFIVEQDGILWFCTANTKDVFKQLNQNPAIEFTSSSQAFVTVRVRGEIKFSSDPAMKKVVFDNCRPNIKEIYKTAENPIFEIFCLDHGKAILSDFSGQPPRLFEF